MHYKSYALLRLVHMRTGIQRHRECCCFMSGLGVVQAPPPLGASTS